MSKPLCHPFSLLLPACGLGLLIGGLYYSTGFAPLQEAVLDPPQKRAAWANPHQLAILRQQYRFYRIHLHRRRGVAEAALFYNQCAEDSDPSVFSGTGLPRHL